MANETVFKRYKGNPIVTSSAVPRANSIHNSAIVGFENGYAGIFRVDEIDMRFRLHAGFSKDGIKWDINPDEINFISDNPDFYVADLSYDPRVTKLDDTYYITWCNAADFGPAIGMAKTTDFKKFYQMENLLSPSSRNCVIFPRKIDGKYAMLHRPSDRGHTPFGDIFYANSPDLTYWGCHRFVMAPTTGWQATKLGPGPVPVETPEGWLLIYHAVDDMDVGRTYRAGAALLDLKDPTKLIGHLHEPLLSPEESWEKKGNVDNVVFPTGAAVFDKRLYIYYGAADTVIAAASVDLNELLDELVKQQGRWTR